MASSWFEMILMARCFENISRASKYSNIMIWTDRGTLCFISWSFHNDPFVVHLLCLIWLFWFEMILIATSWFEVIYHLLRNPLFHLIELSQRPLCCPWNILADNSIWKARCQNKDAPEKSIISCRFPISDLIWSHIIVVFESSPKCRYFYPFGKWYARPSW